MSNIPKANPHPRASAMDWIVVFPPNPCDEIWNHPHTYLPQCDSVRGWSLKWFSSVQSLSCVWLLQSYEPQHARPPCQSPTSGVYLDSCPLSQWCHPTISSSVVPFSSCPQSFPASGSIPMSQFFASGGQTIRVSASTSVLPMNIQDWLSLGWTDWISLESKGLARVFSNTTVQKHQFFSAQPSLWSNSHIHTWLLEKPYSWLDETLWTK